MNIIFYFILFYREFEVTKTIKCSRIFSKKKRKKKKENVLDFNVHPKLVGRDLVAIFVDIGGNYSLRLDTAYFIEN